MVHRGTGNSGMVDPCWPRQRAKGKSPCLSGPCHCRIGHDIGFNAGKVAPAALLRDGGLRRRLDRPTGSKAGYGLDRMLRRYFDLLTTTDGP
ncbi:hypothetical protein [Oleisolibacter albus]|uniref:hypothetical protein n=1 Tax=Oleisolibacter albus TaxID=2171757 RepID=UPI0012D82B7D|nr:hypothetical protein [Oleisolibacter albus]